jgi:hypothetical protein
MWPRHVIVEIQCWPRVLDDGLLFQTKLALILVHIKAAQSFNPSELVDVRNRIPEVREIENGTEDFVLGDVLMACPGDYDGSFVSAV